MAGGTTALLNVTSSDNGGVDGQGRGIVTWSSVHIENAHVLRNEERGVNAGTATARILASTIVGNDLEVANQSNRREVISSATLYVYNSIIAGTGTSVDINGGSATCDYNIVPGSSGSCSGTHDIEVAPQFTDSTKTILVDAGTPTDGVDDGVNLSTVANAAVRIAHQRDHDGVSRAGDPPNIGAFERPAPTNTPGPTNTFTSGPTHTRTRTPTITKTPPPSHTPTRRFTRTRAPSSTPTPTPLPCPSTPCPNGCGGDCDCGGTVSVNELVFGVNNVLDRVDPPCDNCFDADHSGIIMVNDLVAAVNNSLHGCPTAPTPTPAGGGTGQGGLEIAVSVGSASGLPGASVSVPISVAGGWGFIAAVQVDLVYSASVVDPYFHCEPSSRLGGGQSVAASLIPAPAGNRRLRVSLVPSFSAIATFTDGEVAVCTFDLSETAPPGGSTIQVQQPGSSDPWGNAFTTSATGGSICVIGGCGCQ